MNVEEALLRAFIVPERRGRYIELLRTPKARSKLLRSLHHLHDFDPRFAERLDPRRPLVDFSERHESYVDKIYDVLRSRGAPEHCYVMSATSELDGQEAELHAALDEVVGHCDGTFISCIPGRLAYF